MINRTHMKKGIQLSVQFSHSVVSNSLWLHEPQHTRPFCPSPTPRVHQNPRPLSWWCHPTISSSVGPFSSCPQSFPASGLFKWVSPSYQVAKVLEFQLQNQSFQWTPRTDLLYNGLVGSPCSPRDSQVFSKTIVQKHQFFIRTTFSDIFCQSVACLILLTMSFVEQFLILMRFSLSVTILYILPLVL